MANSTAKNESNKRYKESHTEKVREWWQRQEEHRLPRDRREYQKAYRLKRKLEGRPVPGGSAYRKKEHQG